MRRFLLGAVSAAMVIACSRSSSNAPPTLPPPPVDAGEISDADAAVDADDGAEAEAGPRPIGPYEVPFVGKRKVYYAVSKSTSGPQRLLVNLHGMCNPPGYACGYWLEAGTDRGFMVCPEGNTFCGPGGPSSWDESFADMDRDLEAAIAIVDAKYPGEISREGSVLTAFSRGAYAAPIIASMHPGRWPYLILAEADVTLNATALRKAGVKAVVLLAGEWGTQIKGERETVKKLQAEHFPAIFLTMKNAGHYYSADIDDLMRQALEFVLSSDQSDAGP